MSVNSSDSVQVPAAPSFWRVVVQALKGEHHDYTTVSLNRAVLLLAIPMVLEMIMESLFAIVDVFWVSRLGRDAVAVVGLTEAVMTLIYAVAIGISFARQPSSRAESAKGIRSERREPPVKSFCSA